MQIGVSAGPECKAALQDVNQLVEQRLATNGEALKDLFGAAEVCILFYLVTFNIHEHKFNFTLVMKSS